MGVFDSVYVTCSKCGANVEFQSKAGDCAMRAYNMWDCPPRIAADLIGEIASCACGNMIKLHGYVFLQSEQHP